MTIKELRAAVKAAEKANKKINGKVRAFDRDAGFDFDVWHEVSVAKRALLLATETPAEKEAREASEAESRARAERDRWKYDLPHEYHFPIRNQGGHVLHPFMGNTYDKPNDTVWGSELWSRNTKPGKPQMRVECHQCSDRVTVHLTRTGNVAVDYPCQYVDGLTVKFRLSIPSGRLAVGNDFRGMGSWVGDPDQEWYDRLPQTVFSEEDAKKYMRKSMPIFPENRENPYYVNNMMGCVNTAHWYADNGLAHAFVGNTCPSVYRLADDHYQIGSEEVIEHEDDFGCDVVPYGAEEVASIGTDLWWFSMVDAEVLLAASHQTEESMKGYVDFVDVIPGVYEFHHHYHEASFDRDSPSKTIFTDIYLVEKF